MNALLRSLIVAAALGLAGCTAVPQSSLIQQALDRLVPPGFTGSSFSGGYKIPMYLSVSVTVEGLQRTGDRWTFSYARYTRDGPAMSYADFTLGRAP